MGALSFDIIFSIGLSIILIIGTVLVIHVVFPYLGSDVACINGQISHIIEINDTVEDLKLTGIKQIMKFKVENCVRCMWYDVDNPLKLNVKWIGQGTGDWPKEYGVAVAWSGFGTPPSDKITCDGNQITGGKWCTLEVSPNSIEVVGGC